MILSRSNLWMLDFTRVIHPGTVNIRGRNYKVFVRISLRSGEPFFHGYEGASMQGQIVGAFGNIYQSLRNLSSKARGWPHTDVLRLAVLWESWVNHQLLAECIHQRAEQWAELRINLFKPIDSYGVHVPGGTRPTWNRVIDVTAAEYKFGRLYVPCPRCKHPYGAAWRPMQLDEREIEFLQSLPAAKKYPAWLNG